MIARRSLASLPDIIWRVSGQASPSIGFPSPASSASRSQLRAAGEPKIEAGASGGLGDEVGVLARERKREPRRVLPDSSAGRRRSALGRQRRRGEDLECGVAVEPERVGERERLAE